MTWNADKPALGNQIANDIPDIEENFGCLGPYQTLYFPATLFVAVASLGGPAALGNAELTTNDIQYEYFAFDDAVAEEAITLQTRFPANWDRGTVKAKVYWTNAAGASAGDTVQWGVRLTAVSDDDALDATEGTAQVISDTLLADGDLHITDATPAITVGGSPAVGDMIHVKVYRDVDGTDDMEEDAHLIGLAIQIKLNEEEAAW